MYWCKEEKRFYDSELDYCFGNQRKTPQVKLSSEFDGLVEIKEPAKEVKKQNNFDDIFE